MKYEIKKAASGWLHSITSGEGRGCKFTGPGKVHMQSRNPVSFGTWVGGLLPVGEK